MDSGTSARDLLIAMYKWNDEFPFRGETNARKWTFDRFSTSTLSFPQPFTEILMHYWPDLSHFSSQTQPWSKNGCPAERAEKTARDLSMRFSLRAMCRAARPAGTTNDAKYIIERRDSCTIGNKYRELIIFGLWSITRRWNSIIAWQRVSKRKKRKTTRVLDSTFLTHYIYRWNRDRPFPNLNRSI